MLTCESSEWGRQRLSASPVLCRLPAGRLWWEGCWQRTELLWSLFLPDPAWLWSSLIPLISAPPSDISKEQRSPHLSGAAAVMLEKKNALVAAKSDDWDVWQMYDRLGPQLMEEDDGVSCSSFSKGWAISSQMSSGTYIHKRCHSNQDVGETEILLWLPTVFFFSLLCGCSAYMYVCEPCACNAQEGQKKISGSPELELRTVC